MWESSMFGDKSASGGFFNNTNDADATPGKGQKTRRLQNVVPVVIRQIKDCPEEEFSLFGMQTQILSIVGIVLDYEVQSTKAMYNIQDHTGNIKAIWWLETDKDNAPKLPSIKENCYVQIFGSLRFQDNEKMMMVLRMFPVSDANVVTSHLLQVIHARLEAEYMASNPTGPTSAIKKNNPGGDLANSMHFLETTAQDSSLTPIQAQIHEILKRAPSMSGTSKTELLSQFPQQRSVEVLEALEFLIDEGHAYSTIDTEHFKATDPM
ncbi:replication protein A 32 kDa subunit [Harmonia axyridis]|uniref:replication protein A 32 kDa subunit n=1 Tax=Harmonia axyridis TaxID=115357 RepID=UPI001E276A84|nr:replication protein A 32 kDa subunit [Harmonia axyridis]